MTAKAIYKVAYMPKIKSETAMFISEHYNASMDGDDSRLIDLVNIVEGEKPGDSMDDDDWKLLLALKEDGVDYIEI